MTVLEHKNMQIKDLGALIFLLNFGLDESFSSPVFRNIYVFRHLDA